MTSTPVSSRSSRRAASSIDSPGSRRPPGSAHCPAWLRRPGRPPGDQQGRHPVREHDAHRDGRRLQALALGHVTAETSDIRRHRRPVLGRAGRHHCAASFLPSGPAGAVRVAPGPSRAVRVRPGRSGAVRAVRVLRSRRGHAGPGHGARRDSVPRHRGQHARGAGQVPEHGVRPGGGQVRLGVAAGRDADRPRARREGRRHVQRGIAHQYGGLTVERGAELRGGLLAGHVHQLRAAGVHVAERADVQVQQVAQAQRGQLHVGERADVAGQHRLVHPPGPVERGR